MRSPNLRVQFARREWLKVFQNGLVEVRTDSETLHIWLNSDVQLEFALVVSQLIMPHASHTYHANQSLFILARFLGNKDSPVQLWVARSIFVRQVLCFGRPLWALRGKHPGDARVVVGEICWANCKIHKELSFSSGPQPKNGL